jgi:hypothetical protein
VLEDAASSHHAGGYHPEPENGLGDVGAFHTFAQMLSQAPFAGQARTSDALKIAQRFGSRAVATALCRRSDCAST